MRHKKELLVYELFFEYPDKRFTLREIESKTKIPRATVQRYITEMKKEGLLNEKNEVINTLFYKTIKSNYFVEKIVSSGLVDELINSFNPSCIILFGSIRKGDSNKESDIDIFVESHVKKTLSLDKYEKKFGHKIDLFVESGINKLQKNLFNNVVNGIKLYGSLKIK